MGNWACDLLLKYIICDNIVSYVLHVYTRVIYKHMTNQYYETKMGKMINEKKNKKREQAVNLKCIQL